jgi:hypothetical protein
VSSEKEATMINRLLAGLQNTANETVTENGAITNKSTFDSVLDLFYHAPAKRGQNIDILFGNAYREDPTLALKVAFYVRDVRGGQGERDTFRNILRWLYKNERHIFEALVPLVPVYGRWDDILEFVDSDAVYNLVAETLYNDLDSEHPSLLAKWMPMPNTSSHETQKLAMKWIARLRKTPRSYRKLMVSLRKKIMLVETLMSAKAFDKIDYEHVPSNANKLYRKAFSKRDGVRYAEFINAVKSGEKTIKAATLYPYDIVGPYIDNRYQGDIDATMEELWKALPNYADTNANALVMVDVSGSMFQEVAKVQNMPIKVAVSLGIYIAERNHGVFKNNFITFTNKPALITLHGYSLRDRINEVFAAGTGYNTNVQAAFDMLLNTAVRNHVSADDMPSKIYIVSDMEFDSSSFAGNKMSNFNAIKAKFAAAGYEMPTLVFWNVASRGKQTPVTKDERGVYLVSGASPSIFKATINAKAITPLDMMLEVLNSDRYNAVEVAFRERV